MSNEVSLDVDALVKEAKILQKKLSRSEKSRVQAEQMKDQTDALYQHLLDEVTRQKTVIQEGQIELEKAFDIIRGSINYASRIQRSILPTHDFVQKSHQDHFIVWEPRDTVGGDVYWCDYWGDGLLTVLGDCTGHGVPGAFMTLIATGALNQAKIEVPTGDVSALMQRMHQLIQVTLGQNVLDGESDDGIELGMCYTPPGCSVMTFVGARFDLFILENGNVLDVKGTKKGIGYRNILATQEYEENRIDLTPGQTFYMTTDGLIDQIGGESRRAFGKRRLRELLCQVADLPLEDQGRKILGRLKDFQNDEIRRDDVAVIGFRCRA